MMRGAIRNSLSWLGAAAFSLALSPHASVIAAEATRLSPAEVTVVAKQIAKLKYPQERALASHWTEAKKAAEFICRPLAMRVLKRRLKNADRVFLGTDDPKTLQLLSDRRLTGSGQVRVGDDWRTFTFSCLLEPETGKAVSFETSLTSPADPAEPSQQATTPNWHHYFGPGPVRSPTFDPPNWPESQSHSK